MTPQHWLVLAGLGGAGLLACQTPRVPEQPPSVLALSQEEVPPVSEPPSVPAQDLAPPVAAPAFEPERVDEVHVAMGTEVRFVSYTTPTLGRDGILRAFGAARAEIERLEQLLSGWRDDSDVGRINHGAGTWISVAKETAFVVQSSLQTGHMSGGVFDISFNVLGDLWRFGDAQTAVPVVPSAVAVKAALLHVDFRKVSVETKPPRVRIEKGMRIGLGGIAKGYIVDRVRDVLSNQGLSAFLVQAGGDLLGVGHKPDGSAWRSGVRDPRGERDAWFAVIDLTDHAFSTAGDYARAFVVDGRRYHHIIDPRTGYPADASRSVTIWAKDALTADAIDDVVFILGPSEGLKLVESLPGVGALIVDKDNKVWISERLRGRVEVIAEPSQGI